MVPTSAEIRPSELDLERLVDWITASDHLAPRDRGALRQARELVVSPSANRDIADVRNAGAAVGAFAVKAALQDSAPRCNGIELSLRLFSADAKSPEWLGPRNLAKDLGLEYRTRGESIRAVRVSRADDKIRWYGELYGSDDELAAVLDRAVGATTDPVMHGVFWLGLRTSLAAICRSEAVSLR